MKLPATVEALGPEAKKRLDALVADAQQRQTDELRNALDQTLKIVPKPLRGVVRRMFT